MGLHVSTTSKILLSSSLLEVCSVGLLRLKDGADSVGIGFLSRIRLALKSLMLRERIRRQVLRDTATPKWDASGSAAPRFASADDHDVFGTEHLCGAPLSSSFVQAALFGVTREIDIWWSDRLEKSYSIQSPFLSIFQRDLALYCCPKFIP